MGDTSEIRFEKEALETKVKKLVVKCQRLEDEKSGVMRIVRAARGGTSDDLPKAIVNLCDRVASLEEACAGNERKSNAQDERISSLLETNAKLTAQASEHTQKVESLQKGHKKQLLALQSDLEASRQEADEKSRELQTLQRESLQLHQDLKQQKKELIRTKEEVNVLRVQSSVAATPMHLKHSKPLLNRDNMGTSQKTPSSAMKPSHPKVGTITRRDNSVKVETTSRGGLSSSPTRSPAPSQRGSKKVPGLGEAGINDENTTECTQS